MVVLKIKVDEAEEELYVDDLLYRKINEVVIPQVQKKDMDWVWVVDGKEGSGKSVLAMQLAKLLDPNFSVDKVTFTPTEFRNAIVNAKQHDCIIFDEAFTGFSSRSSLTETNKLLVEMMMEMRQKNLYVIIVLPTFFMLEKYVALFRARGLFHVYMKGGLRGRWLYFNPQNKNFLYIKGKKFMSYAEPKSRFRGRFTDKYTINEKEYRKKKALALKQKNRATKAETFKQQRDTLLMILAKRFELSHLKISNICKEFGIQLERKTISESIIEREKQMGYQKTLDDEEAKEIQEEKEPEKMEEYILEPNNDETDLEESAF